MGAGSPAGGFVNKTAPKYAPDPICRLCGNAQTGSQTAAIVAGFQEYTMNQSKGSKLSLRNRTVGMAALFAAAALASACSQQPAAPVVVVNDKVYSVAPDAAKVAVGIVSGEITGMKVTERVEEVSGKVSAPAKLSGKLVIKNTSADQSVSMLEAKIIFVDSLGKPLVMEDNRAEPVVKMDSSYGAKNRLDPGQEMTQTLDVEFPAAALKAGVLKEVRIALVYAPAAYNKASLNFPVALSSK